MRGALLVPVRGADEEEGIVTLTALATALDRDRKLKEEYGDHIARLEALETEAWAKYSRLSSVFRVTEAAYEHKPRRATKGDVKVARTRAIRAHRTHQSILSETAFINRLWISWRVGRG